MEVARPGPTIGGFAPTDLAYGNGYSCELLGSGRMNKLAAFVGATAGGWLGWWLGAKLGIMTAFMVSMVGTGLGIYIAVRFARQYE